MSRAVAGRGVGGWVAAAWWVAVEGGVAEQVEGVTVVY